MGSKVRYAEKVRGICIFSLHFRTVVFFAQFEHPYKPWTKEHGDESVAHLQGRRISSSGLFRTAPRLGRGCTARCSHCRRGAQTSAVGQPRACLAYAKFNRDYATGYMESAEVI